MSYILDALKRADRERKQGEIPDLKSVSPATGNSDIKQSGMLWLLPLFIAAIAIVWFKPWESGTQVRMNRAPVVAPSPNITPQPSPAIPQERAAPVQPAPTPQVEKQATAPATIEPVETAQTAPSASSGIPGIMELPASIRSQLPSLKISGHIYDENPSSRMVIINDKVLREGKYLSGDLAIEEITNNGVVLNFSGTRFFMSPFDSWSR